MIGMYPQAKLGMPMEKYCCPSPQDCQPEPEASRALNELGCTIDRLAHLVPALEEKLRMVLACTPGQEDAPAKELPYRTQLANTIECDRLSITRICSQLDSMLQRLEV